MHFIFWKTFIYSLITQKSKSHHELTHWRLKQSGCFVTWRVGRSTKHIVHHGLSHLARSAHMWVCVCCFDSMHQCFATKTLRTSYLAHLQGTSTGGETMRHQECAARLLLLYINYNPYIPLPHKCHLSRNASSCPSGNHIHVAAANDRANVMWKRCDERVFDVHRLSVLL